MNPFAQLIERPQIVRGSVVRPKNTRAPRPQTIHVNPWNLTPKEAEVLETFATKGSSGAAADFLKVSTTTVENHTRSAKLKMGAETTLLAVLTYDRWNRE